MSLIRSTSTVAGRRIAVALSGGVDSSVAAHLLIQQHDTNSVVGVHMSNWDYDLEDTKDRHLPDCLEQEWKDAQAVAKHLGISIHHASFTKDYWNSVFEPYCQKLQSNHMPNPDVDCNRHVKFGVLKEYTQQRLSCDALATGHYARLWDPRRDPTMPDCLQEALDAEPALSALVGDETPTLLAAVDTSKDQSYFLSGVLPDGFTNVLFPLGHLKKRPQKEDTTSAPTTRDIAHDINLPTKDKRESMGICFVGKRSKFSDFVHQYIEPPIGQGTLVSVDDGTIMGTFDPATSPLVYATIGQGAKVSGGSQKWFVVGKQDATTVTICPGTHHPALYSDRLYLDDLNWISKRSQSPLQLKCRIRHLQPLVDCELRPLEEGGYEVVFEKPVRGIAPGQAAVFYVGNGLVCVGGGPITKRGPSYYELNKDLPSELHPAGHNDLSTSTLERVAAS
jgi:tRNA U34 2-thiouridine synthase MnmA/TrmU